MWNGYYYVMVSPLSQIIGTWTDMFPSYLEFLLFTSTRQKWGENWFFLLFGKKIFSLNKQRGDKVFPFLLLSHFPSSVDS